MVLRKISVKGCRVTYRKNRLKRGEWDQRAFMSISSRVLETIDKDFGLNGGKEEEERKRYF